MSTTEQQGQLSSFGLVVQLEGTAQQIESLTGRLQKLLEASGEEESPEEQLRAQQVHDLLADVRRQVEHADQQLHKLEDHWGCSTPETKVARPKVQVPAKGLRGSTQFISLPELLNLLATQSKTGTLHIKAADERFVLEFIDGMIVHAASNSPLPDQRLGEILVRNGFLAQEALDEFLESYDPKTGPIGSALAHADLVSSQDLHDALSEQVRTLFQRIFAIDEALFYFADGEVRKLEFRVRLNTTRLLLESARQQDEGDSTWL